MSKVYDIFNEITFSPSLVTQEWTQKGVEGFVNTPDEQKSDKVTLKLTKYGKYPK